MLDVLDKELEKRGHHFVRYADDCNIYVRSQKAGERVLAGIERFLEKRLKLKINKAKSAVAKASVRKFLGFSFIGGTATAHRAAGARPLQSEGSGADAAHAWSKPRADCQGVCPST
jgi:RNA-directed DNA polymerase